MAEPYDAFVIGGATYQVPLAGRATRFVKKHRAVLAESSDLLFSAGAIETARTPCPRTGTDRPATPGRRTELSQRWSDRGATAPAWVAVVSSAPPVGMAERFMHLMPASARDAMPAGDFRDWPAIDAWAAEIAWALQPVPA